MGGSRAISLANLDVLVAGAASGADRRIGSGSFSDLSRVFPLATRKTNDKDGEGDTQGRIGGVRGPTAADTLPLVMQARRARGFLSDSPLSFFDSVQDANLRLEDPSASPEGVYALQNNSVCPITGVTAPELDIPHHVVVIGCEFTGRSPPSIKRWIHTFALAVGEMESNKHRPRISKTAFAALIGHPDDDGTGGVVDLLFAFLGEKDGSGVGLLPFLVFASAFARGALQDLRLALIFALTLFHTQSRRNGYAVRLQDLVELPELMLGDRRGLGHKLLSVWTQGEEDSHDLDWPGFLAKFSTGEIMLESKLTLHFPNTDETRKWMLPWLSNPRVYSTVAFADDAPLLAVCLAVTEDLHLPPHIGQTRAEEWMETFERHELYSVDDVAALTPAQWDAVLSTSELPAGLFSRLAVYGVVGKGVPGVVPKRGEDPHGWIGSSLVSRVRAKWAMWKMHVMIDKPLLIWIALLLVLVVEETSWSVASARSYPPHVVLGQSLEFAKAFAAIVRSVTALIFLPVADTITMVITRGLGTAFPALRRISLRPTKEHMMGLHRVGGVVAFLAGMGHTLSHIINAIKITQASESELEAGFGPGTPLEPLGRESTVSGILFTTWLGISGVILVLSMCLIVLCAHPRIRRGWFELFYYPHHAFLVYVIILAAHPTTTRTAMFVLPGFVIYVTSRLLSLIQSLRRTECVDLALQPDDVIKLAFAKTRWMKEMLRMGDYVFVQVPSISKAQWHPFSVASSPQMEQVELFIKAVGSRDSWTYSLAKLAKEHTGPAAALPLRISGPYAADPLPYLSYSRTIIISSGIGITPFAAVLTDLIHHLRVGNPLPLKSLSFIWVCRSLDSFKWFTTVLSVLESIFYTSIHEPDLNLDIRLFVTRDTYSDLPFTVIRGRPDFHRILGTIAEEVMDPREEKAGVFFSGNGRIALAVYQAVKAWDSRFEYLHELCFT